MGFCAAAMGEPRNSFSAAVSLPAVRSPHSATSAMQFPAVSRIRDPARKRVCRLLCRRGTLVEASKSQTLSVMAVPIPRRQICGFLAETFPNNAKAWQVTSKPSPVEGVVIVVISRGFGTGAGVPPFLTLPKLWLHNRNEPRPTAPEKVIPLFPMNSFGDTWGYLPIWR